jgi:uncharacterized protein (TIGR02284 family)
MTDRTDHLKSLHTALIDARNGYEEALEDAEGKGMTPLFRELMVLHTSDAEALAAHLSTLGEIVDEQGSFMSTVHRTVMNVRSLFGGLDESILPGLIDGEERLLGYYDEAIQTSTTGTAEHTTLVKQRQTLHQKIAGMKMRKDMAA